MIDLIFVPMPRPQGKVGLLHSKFRSTYMQTLDMLEEELKKLGARAITIQAGYTIGGIRNDGWPKKGTNPSHPACALQFTNRKGESLVFRAFKFSTFSANLRAIAMTLEALRAVDRYGVVEGEQYSGFKQLGSASPQYPPSRIEAALFIAALTVRPKDYILECSAEQLNDLGRQAMKVSHPDAGGSQDQFIKTTVMMGVLRGASNAA